MEKIVFDTNILIEISRKNWDIIKIYDELNDESIFITAVVYAEFMRGVLNKSLLKPYQRFLDGFKLLNSNADTDTLMMEVFKQYSLSHRPTIADIQIASVCLHYDAKLFTLNTKDFSFVSGIKFL